MKLTSTIRAAITNVASFRVLVALTTSTAVTAGVSGPLAYQAIQAQHRHQTTEIAAERGKVSPGGPQRSPESTTVVGATDDTTTSLPIPNNSVAPSPSGAPTTRLPGQTTLPGSRPVPNQPTTTVNPNLTPYVMVSVDPSHSEAQHLDGARVSGQVYVFVNLPNVKSVTYYSETDVPTGTPLRTVTAPPFALNPGATEPGPTDVNALFGGGRHRLLAVVTLNDGTQRLLPTAFDVLG